MKLLVLGYFLFSGVAQASYPTFTLVRVSSSPSFGENSAFQRCKIKDSSLEHSAILHGIKTSSLTVIRIEGNIQEKVNAVYGATRPDPSSGERVINYWAHTKDGTSAKLLRSEVYFSDGKTQIVKSMSREAHELVRILNRTCQKSWL